MKPFFFPAFAALILKISTLRPAAVKQKHAGRVRPMVFGHLECTQGERQHLVSVGEIIKSVSEFKNIMAEY